MLVPASFLLSVHIAVFKAAIGSAASDVRRTLEATECDVVSTGPICFNEGSSVLLPGTYSEDLLGHWTFDEEMPIDSSGRGNHGKGAVEHGPSPAGSGSSAFFASNFLEIPHMDDLESDDFSYTFWVYIVRQTVAESREAPAWCSMIRKGVHITAAAKHESAPTILFSQRTRRVRVSMSTTAGDPVEGEYVDSFARVQPNQWVHLAVVHHAPAADDQTESSRVLFYINGILDGMLETRGKLKRNTDPLYVGGDPFTANECSFKLYMDDLRLYGRALSPHELEAEAGPALSGVDPSFVRLGCVRCTLKDVLGSCPQDRHVCTALELHTGGYEVAQSVGWLEPGMHVWTHAAAAKYRMALYAAETSAETSGVGIALCCEGA